MPDLNSLSFTASPDARLQTEEEERTTTARSFTTNEYPDEPDMSACVCPAACGKSADYRVGGRRYVVFAYANMRPAM